VPAFNVSARSDVNGKKELELYTFLKSKCPPPTHASFPKGETFWDPIKPTDLVWNFEKFLVNGYGHPMFRFMPDVEPFDLVPLLEEFLSVSPDPQTVVKHLEDLEAKVKLRVAAKEAHKRHKHH